MQKVKRIGEFIKKNLKWILLFLCTIIFLDLVEDVFEKEIMKLDIITYNFYFNLSYFRFCYTNCENYY